MSLSIIIDERSKIHSKFEDKLIELIHESESVWSEVTSFWHSTCQNKVANSMATQLNAKSERINFCIESEQKAVNVCHPNPCLNGGIYYDLTSTGSAYKCIACPKRTNVTCSAENRCWRLNDTLYVVIETKLNWTEAKVECESEGMTLAMPKDKEKTQFLFYRLRSLYQYPNHGLWLGLKREESGWYWVDGNELGSYTEGYTHMKSGNGSLYLNDGSEMWEWGFATERMYPLCETHLLSN